MLSAVIQLVPSLQDMSQRRRRTLTYDLTLAHHRLVGEGGGAGQRARESTHTQTHSSCYREDGGRCGSGGADLQPAATSLLKAGEFASRSPQNRLQVSAGHLQPNTVEWLQGKITARFRRSAFPGLKWKRTADLCTYDGLCLAEAQKAQRLGVNETAHRGPVVGRCRVSAGLIPVLSALPRFRSLNRQPVCVACLLLTDAAGYFVVVQSVGAAASIHPSPKPGFITSF
ncbi:hypothetical protein Q8A73_012315 [Channa argus]|nr:hypothetical protein Q8A73_012315 [Channa argus]